MKARRDWLRGILGLGLLATPLGGAAQPALEQLRFDPPRMCPQDTFRWGFAYRDLPGGLAALEEFEVRGLWDGPGERPIRSVLSPTRDDLRPHTADQGRFESRLTHAGPPRPTPAGGAEIRYTLRAVLADGREVTSATSVRYLDDRAWSGAGSSGPDPVAYRLALQAVKGLVGP